MATVTVKASDFVNPNGSVVDCAQMVAAEVASALRSGDNVRVSVRGLRGVSSSFFNVILATVGDAIGSQLTDARFDVETETEVQKLVYRRSLEAFMKRASEGSRS